MKIDSVTAVKFGIRQIVVDGQTFMTIHPKSQYRLTLDEIPTLEEQRLKVANDYKAFLVKKADGDFEPGTTFTSVHRVGWKELLKSIKIDGHAELCKYAERQGIDLGVPIRRMPKVKKAQKAAQKAKEVAASKPEASHQVAPGIASMSWPDRVARTKKIMDQAEILNSVMWQGMRGDIAASDCKQRSVEMLQSMLAKAYDMLSALEVACTQQRRKIGASSAS